jgi:hypothetical protein
VIGSPASSEAVTCSGDSLPSAAFCAGGAAEAAAELPVAVAGVAAAAGGHLRGEQAQHDPVLVGRPGAAVAAQERGAGALLAAEADGAVQQPADEPLEADRHLDQPPAEVGRHPVDHAAGHQRLAHRGPSRPVPLAAEQVGDGHREVVVGVEQAGAGGDDAVPVGVGVVAERHVEAVLELDQAGHGVRRGAVHADLAVPVQVHEPERRVDRVVGDLKVKAVAVADGRPVGDRGAAERVDAEPQAGAGDRVEVQDGRQVADVGVDVVVAVHARTADGALVGHPRHAVQAGREQAVGLVLHPAGDVGVGRAAVGRVVLEAAVVGWVVRGGHHDAVGQVLAATPVPGEDRVGDGGRGRVPARGVHHHVHLVAGQHLDGGAERRLGQPVGVAAQVQRPVDALPASPAADRLGHGEDVRLVEGRLEGRAAVPGGAEHHLLRRHRRVRLQLVVGADEGLGVDQRRRLRRLAGVLADGHGAHPFAAC